MALKTFIWQASGQGIVEGLQWLWWLEKNVSQKYAFPTIKLYGNGSGGGYGFYKQTPPELKNQPRISSMYFFLVIK